MSKEESSSENKLLREECLIDLEELRKLPVSDRAKLTAKRVNECRFKHKIADCPSCISFSNTDCPFNRLFKIKREHVPTHDTLKHNKRNFSEVKEEQINREINKWKNGQ